MWTVVVIGADGTVSAVSKPGWTEYQATLWANDHENDETSWTCHVVQLENPDYL